MKVDTLRHGLGLLNLKLDIENHIHRLRSVKLEEFPTIVENYFGQEYWYSGMVPAEIGTRHRDELVEYLEGVLKKLNDDLEALKD